MGKVLSKMLVCHFVSLISSIYIRTPLFYAVYDDATTEIRNIITTDSQDTLILLKFFFVSYSVC